MRYIRGNFVGDGTPQDVFRAPDGWRHIVDMRRDDGSGGGVFVGPDATPVPADAVELQQGDLTGAALDALWAELTFNADPLRLTAPRSLMPARTGRMTLWLPEREQARSLEVQPGDPEWASVLALIRLGYMEKRAEARAGLSLRPVFGLDGRQTGTVVDMQFHRRYLGALVEKYGLDYRTFQLRDSALERAVLGPTLPDETPLPHSTTLTESFNTANSDTLGPDQTWAELGSTLAVIEDNRVALKLQAAVHARAEADLASVDHFAEIDVSEFNVVSGVPKGGVTTRFSSSAETAYYYQMTEHVSAPHTVIIGHVVTGSRTELDSSERTNDLPERIQGEVDGSDIRLLVDDVVEIATISDSTIAGGTRAGIALFRDLFSFKVFCDNWLAKDGQLAGADNSPTEAVAAVQMPIVMAPIPAQVVGY